MNNLVENYVFTNALKETLFRIEMEPEKMPKFLVFFGEPATGKTTFAKTFANNMACDTQHPGTTFGITSFISG
ncbi:MAG: hypothetical protein HOM06_07245 [Gammaproteobacteria bacterium]|jgi:AAA+ superfamily predicted ATPase|nr:hypothetical protein [Gammaproteobacteria bacterium]MBT5445562.1 hypothetical protein [Gammaproteobacteria bacterium]MBT7722603.1 hypothetical protein [Gammaproteobacteria bacterium]